MPLKKTSKTKTTTLRRMPRKKMTTLRKKMMLLRKMSKTMMKALKKKMMALKRTLRKKMTALRKRMMLLRRTSKKMMMLQRRKRKLLMEVMTQPLLFAQPIVLRMTFHVGSNSGSALIQFLVGMILNLYHQLLQWALSVN